jgi:hypothetical protein
MISNFCLEVVQGCLLSHELRGAREIHMGHDVCGGLRKNRLSTSVSSLLCLYKVRLRAGSHLLYNSRMYSTIRYVLSILLSSEFLLAWSRRWK